MADSTVATMTAASALDGTELYYGIQGGADKKVTGAQIKTLVSASPTLVTPNLGTPSAGVLTNATGLPLTTGVTGTLPVANGGTGTTSPGIVAGTNVTVTGTWPNQTVNSSGGGGGSPGGSTLQIQYNAAGSFAGMSGTSWDNTNQSLTVSGATVTTSKPLLDLAQTWNAGAVVFTAMKVSVTNTASDPASLLADWRVGGTSKANIDYTGKGTFTGILFNGNISFANGFVSINHPYLYVANGQVGLPAAQTLGWSSNSNAAVTADFGIGRNAAGVGEINNGTAGAFADLKLRNLIPGATQSTSMTNGFMNIPGAAGAPSGTPAVTTGVPLYFDTTNLKLYAYSGGAWKSSAVFT